MRRSLALSVWIVLLGALAGAAADKSGLKPTVISLPAGPGSIEGLGASFEPRLNNGTSSYRVPLAMPPGRNGFDPGLELVYDSGFGNGVFGMGWRLELPHLVRQSQGRQPFYTDYPAPNGVDDDGDGEVDEFDEFDTFYWNGSGELVPTPDGVWRLRNEGEFLRFTRLGDGWRVQRPDGVTLVLGSQASSRIQDDQGHAYAWQIDEMRDPHGNRIAFEWAKLDSESQVYVTRITYNEGGAMEVRFGYQPRPDVLVSGRPRFALRTRQRCISIEMRAAGLLVRRYQVGYAPTSPTQPLSLLSAITQVGADGLSTLPPATFESVTFTAENAAVIALPEAPAVDLGNGNIELVDLNADALPDILDTSSNPHGFHLNRGASPDGTVGFAPYAQMNHRINLYLAAETTALADLDGNARTELLNLFSGKVELFAVGDDLEWTPRPEIANATFSLSDPEVRLLDVNGDRFIDVMMTAGGFNTVWICLQAETWSSPLSVPSPLVSLRFSRPETRLADMNGDRLMDLVYLASGACFYYTGLGSGSYSNRVDVAEPPMGVTDLSRLLMADVNGDGMSDVIFLGDRVRVWLNLGLDPADVAVGHFAAPFEVEAPQINAATVFRAGDLNGNGSVDLILNTQVDGVRRMAYLDLAPGEQPYQLKRIRNGIGRTTTVEYRTSVSDMAADRERGAPWPDPVPLAIPVVAGIEVDAGRPPASRQEFRYHNGYYDQAVEEFRGFARAEKRDFGDASVPDLTTVYHFDTGKTVEALKGRVLLEEAGPGETSAAWTHYDAVDNDDDGLIDEPDELDRGHLFYRAQHDWTTHVVAASVPGDNRSIRFPCIQSTTREIFELGHGTPVTLRWDYAYDNFGNQTNLFESGRLDGDWGDERRTATRYTAEFPSGQANWILHRPVERLVLTGGGTLVAQERHFYDDETFSGGNLGEVVRGDLTMTLAWADPLVAGSSVQTVRRKYDAYGNLLSLHDPLWGAAAGHSRTLSYDPTYHTFPVREVIHTGNPGLASLTLAAAYDARWGAVTETTDFNGSTTRYAYDVFGRLIAITKPGDPASTVEYDYVLAQSLPDGSSLSWIETRQREQSDGGTVDSRVFYDGLGRAIMTRAEGECPGQVVVSQTVRHNRRQLVWKSYLPCFEEGATLDFVPPSYSTGCTETEYDALGREVRVGQPPDATGTVATARTTYEPLCRTARDPEQTRLESPHFGCARREVEDGLLDEHGRGRLRVVTEVVKLNDAGEPLNHTVEWETAYRYDLLDRFAGYTDAQGNQKLVRYDGLGRVTFMDDPDRGWSWWAYDPAGNVIRTRDARGLEIAYGYDGANRLTEEFETADHERLGNDLQREERWTVDPAALPARPPDVEYHYDLPWGELDPGDLWQGQAPRAVASAVLRQQPEPTCDVNGDGVVDVADVIQAARQPPAVTRIVGRNTQGRRAWVRDHSGEEHASYDERGRLEFVLRRLDAGSGGLTGFLTTTEYDSMDRTTRLTYPDRSQVCYDYNSRGLLERIPGVLNQHDYSPAGQPALRALANGVVTQWEYDHRQRLAQVLTTRPRDGRSLQNLRYLYDQASHLLGIEDGRSDAELEAVGAELGLDAGGARQFRATQQFAYDSLSRLTQASSVQGVISYRYDRIGNMVRAETVTPQPGSPVDLGAIASGGSAGTWHRVGRRPADPPGPHAMTAWERGPSGPGVLAYDATGNVLQHAGLTLTWNPQGRLASLANGSQAATYTYDSNQKRARKTVAGSDSTTTVLYVSPTAEVRDGALAKYVYAGEHRVCRLDAPGSASPQPATAEFFLHDHLGSTAFTLHGDRLAEQLAHYPYGTPRAAARASSTGAIYTFAGKERDAESGLHYWEARYLEAASGRFLSVDALVLSPANSGSHQPQQLNAYAYSLNSPMTYYDPDGNVVFILPAIAWGLALYGAWETGQTLGTAAGASYMAWDAYSRQDWNALDRETGVALEHTTKLAVGLLESKAAQKLMSNPKAERLVDKLTRPVFQRFRDAGFRGKETLRAAAALTTGDKPRTSRAAIRGLLSNIAESLLEKATSSGAEAAASSAEKLLPQAANSLESQTPKAPTGAAWRSGPSSAPASGVLVSGAKLSSGTAAEPMPVHKRD